ncbi:MAG: sulfatase [Tannerella sp.]|jgi:arylsulfatase A-like enzyme|nr:sulfatase [Tannerella sp.]
MWIGSVAFVTLSGCVREQPNVIYVFPDQFRNHALEFWNENDFRDQVNFRPDPVHTPNLNKFAKESFVLTSAVSNCPLSSPHRGMLLTGMYPDGSGVVLNCNSSRPVSSLKTDVIAISDVYSRSGYDCAYIGKLHADFPTPDDPENPGHYVENKRPVWDTYTPPERRHGFNYWYSYGTFDVHKQPHYWDTDGKRHEIREWSPKHEADKAIAYLRNEGNVRDVRKPFFMMISMNPPHSPYSSLDDCMEEDYNLYKDIPISQLLIRPNADTTMAKAVDSRYYFASVTGVDREFGRILKALKELGLEKNTIVVFASDHGETMCSQGTDDPKNSPYAESLNIPFMVRYPERIKHRVDNLLLSTPDIMPTLLGLSGLGESIPATVQGHDYSSVFFRKNEIKRPEAALYIQNMDGEKDENGLVRTYFPSSRGIKSHRYTLALYIDRETKELKETLFFDDVEDPYQLNNLNIEQNARSFKKLCGELAVLLKDADDPWYREQILSDIIPYK